MNAKWILRIGLSAITAAAATSAIAGNATSLQIREEAAQMKADQSALQRQAGRLQSDQAILQADRASGKMSAVSGDGYTVYQASTAVKGEADAIANDLTNPLQLRADAAALKREVGRLEAAIDRLDADTAAGRMAAMSPDGEKVFKDRQAVAAEQKVVASDKTRLGKDRHG